MEKSVMEEERDKIRELHQRQQDSIKSLQALESRFCGVAIDDVETFQGSSNASRVPTLELMAKAQTMKLPPLEKDIESQKNTVTIDISATDDSDTSDSDATMTDEDDEHISIEELSKAAKHVRKLLRRIIVLQKSLGNNQKPHQKRRVRKIYQRFCHKFESGINVTQATGPSRHGSPATRSSVECNPASDLGDMEEGTLENFDFDSFLHVGSESTPFPVVPQQQQPMSPLPPRQHLNEPRPEEFHFGFNHTVSNMNSVAASSFDARFQIPEFTVPGAYFSPVTSPALNVQSHQHAHQQSQNTTSGTSTKEGSRSEDSDRGRLPEDKSLMIRSFRSTRKRKRPHPHQDSLDNDQLSPLLHAQNDPQLFQDPFPRSDQFNLNSSNAHISAGNSPHISPRLLPHNQQVLPTFQPDTESNAVRQRNSHVRETPPVLVEMRTPLMRFPLSNIPEQEAGRHRDNKRRRIRSIPDVGLEGAYSTLLQRKKKRRKQIFEIEKAFDPSDRDVVDVLLEQWTVPEYRRS
jgi:hypothetical protein